MKRIGLFLGLFFLIMTTALVPAAKTFATPEEEHEALLKQERKQAAEEKRSKMPRLPKAKAPEAPKEVPTVSAPKVVETLTPPVVPTTPAKTTTVDRPVQPALQPVQMPAAETVPSMGIFSRVTKPTTVGGKVTIELEEPKVVPQPKVPFAQLPGLIAQAAACEERLERANLEKAKQELAWQENFTTLLETAQAIEKKPLDPKNQERLKKLEEMGFAEAAKQLKQDIESAKSHEVFEKDVVDIQKEMRKKNVRDAAFEAVVKDPFSPETAQKIVDFQKIDPAAAQELRGMVHDAAQKEAAQKLINDAKSITPDTLKNKQKLQGISNQLQQVGATGAAKAIDDIVKPSMWSRLSDWATGHVQGAKETIVEGVQLVTDPITSAAADAKSFLKEIRNMMWLVYGTAVLVPLAQTLQSYVSRPGIPPAVPVALPSLEKSGKGWLEWAGLQRRDYFDLYGLSVPDELMLPLQEAMQAAQSGQTTYPALVLAGGTARSAFAKALADTYNMKQLVITSDLFMGKTENDVRQILQKLAETVKTTSSLMVVVEDIDRLFQTRLSVGGSSVGALLLAYLMPTGPRLSREFMVVYSLSGLLPQELKPYVTMVLDTASVQVRGLSQAPITVSAQPIAPAVPEVRVPEVGAHPGEIFAPEVATQMPTITQPAAQQPVSTGVGYGVSPSQRAVKLLQQRLARIPRVGKAAALAAGVAGGISVSPPTPKTVQKIFQPTFTPSQPTEKTAGGTQATEEVSDENVLLFAGE